MILAAPSFPLTGDVTPLFRYPQQFSLRERSSGSHLHPSMNLTQYLAQSDVFAFEASFPVKQTELGFVPCQQSF